MCQKNVDQKGPSEVAHISIEPIGWCESKKHPRVGHVAHSKAISFVSSGEFALDAYMWSSLANFGLKWDIWPFFSKKVAGI